MEKKRFCRIIADKSEVIHNISKLFKNISVLTHVLVHIEKSFSLLKLATSNNLQ